jgi:hypothetical protein
MNGMKYLVFKCGVLETIYIFQANIQHKDFASILLKASSPYIGKPVRGGFVYFVQRGEDPNLGQLQCRGEAFSLSLLADPKKDTELLLQQIGF